MSATWARVQGGTPAGECSSTVWIMVSFIRNVSFDCSDPYALAGFWSEVIGHPIHPECLPGDPEAVIEPADGPRLFFQAVPEGKAVKNRVHVCLQPHDRDRDVEVDRVLALGATVLADHRTPGREGWVVLCDPAGNEFCLTRSSSERHS
jgi:predicted enzyme related to lactoylglutathione lyase